MNCCIVAIAALISVAAATRSIQLSHAKLASSHEDIQQLSLTGSSSSLQSEASIRASDENLVMLDELEHMNETQPSFIDKEVSSIHISELDRGIYKF